MASNKTWELIHAERSSLVDVLSGLTREQWAKPSYCAGWNVHTMAGHIVRGAEQSPGKFFTGLARSGMRFNVMTQKDARQFDAVDPQAIIERLAARTTTTNRPPAPPETMLGEVTVHGLDICRPLGVDHHPSPEAVTACLSMFAKANFPVGAKRRIDGLHLVATDLDWSTGSGPEVRGSSESLLLAMTGRKDALADLAGDGVATLSSRP